jgi:hypothetical protein
MIRRGNAEARQQLWHRVSAAINPSPDERNQIQPSILWSES